MFQSQTSNLLLMQRKSLSFLISYHGSGKVFLNKGPTLQRTLKNFALLKKNKVRLNWDQVKL